VAALTRDRGGPPTVRAVERMLAHQTLRFSVLDEQIDLTRSSNSRLRPPTMATSEADLSPRHSFESGADSTTCSQSDSVLDLCIGGAARVRTRSSSSSVSECCSMTDRDADGRASTPDEDELEERVADIERLTQRDSPKIDQRLLKSDESLRPLCRRRKSSKVALEGRDR
jgi:hypothetical protein